MNDMETSPTIDHLEREKATLIQRYLEIQDIVDDYNEQMYRVCCEIEILNRKIDQARTAQKTKAAPTSSAPKSKAE